MSCTICKNNSKQMINLQVEIKTIKLLVENVCELLLGKDTTLETGSTKEQTDKLDFIQIKNLCSLKDLENEKKDPRKGKKIFKNHIPDKRLVSRIHNKSSKLDNKKTKDRSVTLG